MLLDDEAVRVGRQRDQRVLQDTLRLTVDQRAGHPAHQHLARPERLDREAELTQLGTCLFRQGHRRGWHVEHERLQQELLLGAAAQRGTQVFEQHALVRRVLVNQIDASFALRDQVRLADLTQHAEVA